MKLRLALYTCEQLEHVSNLNNLPAEVRQHVVRKPGDEGKCSLIAPARFRAKPYMPKVADWQPYYSKVCTRQVCYG